MPLPHSGMWDRLCVSLGTAPEGFDGSLPLIGRLGRHIRRRRRGLGRAMGTSARRLGQLSRLDLRSPRLRVLLRRHGWSLAATAASVAVWGAVAVAVLNMRTVGPYPFVAVMGVALAQALFRAVRRPRAEEWTALALQLRRSALVRATARFRALHVDSGPQSAEQLARLIAGRRDYWEQRLAGLKSKERNAFAYREVWWLALPMFGFLAVMMLGSSRLTPGYYGSPLIAVVVFYAFLFTVPGYLAKRRIGVLRRSLAEHSCSDCGYPLADFTLGSWRSQPVAGLGPRRCPECGCPWPLLPPPRARG